MAKRTPVKTNFSQVVQALLDVKPFPARYIQNLSDIQPKDAVKLRQAWPEISTQQRRTLLEDLESFGAEDNVLDFSEVGELALNDSDAQVRRTAVRLLAS